MLQEFAKRTFVVAVLSAIFVLLPQGGVTKSATAQTSIPSGWPFGGTVAFAIPSSPICPFAHSIIVDYVSFSTYGVALVPGSQYYANQKLFVPGTFVVGSIAPFPLPCLLSYPVLPIVQVGTS